MKYYLFFVLSSITAALTLWISLIHEQSLTLTEPKTLSANTIAKLNNMPGKITIQSFSMPQPIIVREYVENLIKQFQQHKKDIEFRFINPDLAPDLVRKHNIHSNGELLIRAQHKTRKLSLIRENTLIDLLYNMHSKKKDLIGFISGHGEHSPYDKGVDGYSTLYVALKKINVLAISLNLDAVKDIPKNTHAIVISSPKQPYSDKEIATIKRYLQAGGRLLWLTEPNNNAYLSKLSEFLKISTHPGIIIDLTSQQYRNASPTFSFISQYPNPDIVSTKTMSIFPKSAALSYQLEWLPILKTNDKTWTETQDITGDIEFNPEQNEQQGPLTIGIAQSTPFQAIVVGDGDFIANRYIGNSDNLSLGLNLFQWLLPKQDAPAEQLIKPEHQLNLSETRIAGIAITLFIIVPFGFLLIGLLIWVRRRHH
ncbi:MAG: GldG family protein [Methylococcales bacterium]|jgi:ABC-type uncharacterized transport system involved in gliding motility auxiliary subunit|nr:GldG family protein [Methylococcales bacterium]MBT7443145.1 GldG family protein [Methylococcales bacterium]